MRCGWFFFFFFKQKTAYEMRISDWSSDVCASDLEERTTEGGLDAAGQIDALHPIVDALGKAGVRVSLFIEPDAAQIEAAMRLGAPVVELHTGRYAHLEGSERAEELRRLADRSEEHTSELQSLMRTSYAVFCLKNKHKLTHTIHLSR